MRRAPIGSWLTDMAASRRGAHASRKPQKAWLRSMSFALGTGLTHRGQHAWPLHYYREAGMVALADKNMGVIGGSRGVGRGGVGAGRRSGARVLAVARQEGQLRGMAQDIPG